MLDGLWIASRRSPSKIQSILGDHPVSRESERPIAR
jgi:hypothetical protein